MNDSRSSKATNQAVAEAENRPMTRCFPASLRPLVTGEKFFNGSDVVERGWLPSPVPESQRTLAQRALSDLDQELRPAERGWISGRVATLLAHYWTPDMGETLQTAVGHDWINILGAFPRHVIEAACVKYLSGNTRARPTPGQILELAQEEVGDQMQQRDRLQACLEFHHARRNPVRPDYRYQVEIGIMTQEEADRHLARWEQDH